MNTAKIASTTTGRSWPTPPIRRVSSVALLVVGALVVARLTYRAFLAYPWWHHIGMMVIVFLGYAAVAVVLDDVQVSLARRVTPGRLVGAQAIRAAVVSVSLLLFMWVAMPPLVIIWRDGGRAGLAVGAVLVVVKSVTDYFGTRRGGAGTRTPRSCPPLA